MSEITDTDGVEFVETEEQAAQAAEDGEFGTPVMFDVDPTEKAPTIQLRDDLTVSQFAALADSEDVEGEIYEVVDRENLPDVLKEWVIIADFSKGRVYIDSPDEAPEDVDVHEGDQGGLYYVTGDKEPEEDADSTGEEGDGPVLPEEFDEEDARGMLSALSSAFNPQISQMIGRFLAENIPEVSSTLFTVLQTISLAEKERVNKQEEDFEREDIVQVENVHEAPDSAVVHCHDELGLYYVDQIEEKSIQKEVEVEVFQINAPADRDYDSDILGIGVDFPNHDVYVDWNLGAFGEDKLDNAHVSIYGSIEDLEQVTEGEIEHIEIVETQKSAAKQLGISESEFSQYLKKSRGVVPARQEEVDRVFEIERECFKSPRGRNTLHEAVVRPDWGLFVAKSDSEIVGHTLIAASEIAAVAVDPDHRGKGYGKELVKKAVAFAKGLSDSAHLKVRTSNSPAISLYADFGFEAEKRIGSFYSDGEDAYLMRKERIYIEDPSEAPEGAEVHEGDQGGLWYDSEDAAEEEVDVPLNPAERQAEIGDDSVHPVMWERPPPDQLGEYISEMQETDFWEDGHETFDAAFFGDENTENEYTDGEGNWDEERLEKHKEWGQNLVNEDAATDEGEQPVGVVLLGPPGAGKGWWQEQVAEGEYGDDFGGRDFTQISSDRTKEPIPEYTGKNAAEVHDEASKVAKDNLAPTAFENEHNVIVDKVANSPEKTLEMVEQMEEAGYDLRAAFVDVPPEKSVHNVTGRYEEEGRFTPLDFTANARGNSYDSFSSVIDGFDIPDEKIGVFDNDVEWGDAPDSKFMGEELLKFMTLFFEEESAKRFINLNHLGSNDGRETRRGRNERRDSGMVGGRLHRSSHRGSRGSQQRRERPVIVNLTKTDWIPFQREDGTQVWQNVSSGEVIDADNPPGNTRVEPETYFNAGAASLVEALKTVTGQLPSGEVEEMDADEIRLAMQDIANPSERLEVVRELETLESRDVRIDERDGSLEYNPSQKMAPTVVSTTGVYKDNWVPYQGPQGGEGWQNVESGEVVYDEQPPGDSAISSEEIEDASMWDWLDAVEAVTGEDLTDEWDFTSVEGVREVIQDMASPEQLAEVLEALSEEDVEYDGEYEVQTEFEQEVAIAVENNEAASEITSAQWNVTSDIENKELLVDALKQIEEDGTKTAKTRVRSRLRGLGLDPDEIDKELREESPDPRDRFDVGDSLLFEWEGEKHSATVSEIGDDDDWWVMEVRFEDGDTDVVDEYDIESALVDNEDYTLEDQIEQVNIQPPREANGVPNGVQDLWNKASTEELQEYIESAGIDPDEIDNPLGVLFDFDRSEADDPGVSIAVQEVVEEFDDGEIDSDEAHQRAREVIAEYPEEFSDVDMDRVSLAKAILWYRDDSDVSDLSEVTDFIDIAGNEVDDWVDADAAKEAYQNVLNKTEPHIGCYALATLKQTEFQNLSNRSYSGKHFSSDGSILIDSTNTEEDIKEIAAHEFGHQMHNILGLEKQFGSYPDSDEWRAFDTEDAVFGVTEPPGRSEVYDDLKKVAKNWDRYQEEHRREIRTYQRRHGVEYLAVSFEYWGEDEAKLQNRDPYMKQFWDVHAGGSERVEEVDDVEVGDEIVLAGGTFPTLYEVEEVGGFEEVEGEEGSYERIHSWELREKNAGGTADHTILDGPDVIEEYFDGGVRHGGS